MNGDEPGWALAVAFAAGLLIGAERERHKGRGAGREAAGIRTFGRRRFATAVGAGLLVVVGAFWAGLLVG